MTLEQVLVAAIFYGAAIVVIMIIRWMVGKGWLDG